MRLEPRGCSPLSAEHGGNRASDRDRLSGLKILIADDHNICLLVAIGLLEILAPSAEILQAVNGAEALEIIHAVRPDLVLMDIEMPVMDGNEATRRLREYEKNANLPRTPVVGLTARALQHEVKCALASGMDACVTKPIDMDVFRSVLREYLRQKD